MKQNNIIAIAQMLQAHGLVAFHSRTLADLLSLERSQAAQLLGRMEAAGLVVQVERGRYLLLGLAPEYVLSNPLFIGCNLVNPAYISFWSALHYYQFTEQAPHTTFVATTHRKPRQVFNGLAFQFVTLPPKSFFGYRREQLAGLPVVIADEEKAILDSLAHPRYAGGLPEAAKALHNALETLDLERLVDYANTLNSPSLGSRLGYLLELFGKRVAGLNVAQGPVRLDPQRPRQGFYHPGWRVYANVSLVELAPAGVA